MRLRSTEFVLAQVSYAIPIPIPCFLAARPRLQGWVGRFLLASR